MAINWTKEQLSAVNADVANIIVTAAAGAGKTQVLAERIVRRIINGTDISRILVMTFTDAAAMEMRARIMSNLEAYLRENPENTRIRQQLSFVPAASISTIHSFCLSALRSNFYKIGLKASFRVGDDSETRILRIDAAEQALEELYGEGNADFLSFSDSFASARDDSNLIDIMLEVSDFAKSSPFPDKWLEGVLEFYRNADKDSFENSDCCKVILKKQKEKLKEAKAKFEEAAELAKSDGCEPWVLLLKNDIETVDFYIAASNGWDSLRLAFDGRTFARRGKEKASDEETNKVLIKLRDDAKKIINENVRNETAYPAEMCADILKSTYPLVNGLVIFVRRFEEIYSALKIEKNIIDFSDFEHMFISLLTENGEPTETAKEIRGQYDEIYVDEYQDSNETQEFIFNLVSGVPEGKPNIFMVGDLKQSIYGFRQTSPRMFLEKKKTYKEGAGEKYRKIMLNKNFRSSDSVIDFVNFVFGNLMSEAEGNVDYKDEECLVCGVKYPAPVLPELNIIDKALSDDEDNGSDIHNIEREARLIAEKINSIVGNDIVFDAKKGESRPAKYSDIAVLLRSFRDKGDMIERVLSDMGIPCYAESKGGYFETAEIEIFLSLLQIIDNPRNDIPLISVMRSPVFEFSEDELAQIRLYDKNTLFYDCITKCTEDTTELSDKCRSFIGSLNKWRHMAEYEPCDELIDFLFEDTGFIHHVSSLPQGEARAANLRLLFEKARKFEESSFHGVFNFIKFIENLRVKGADYGEAKLIGENNDVVRIMTIHKSKGLEFPIVFLPDFGKQFNPGSHSGNILLHRKYGIAPVFIDPVSRAKYTTPLYDAAKISIKDEDIAEELRVLYVALTRAKERLIIYGTVMDLQKAKYGWENNAKNRQKGLSINPKSYLDWISICVASCKEGFENCPYVRVNILPCNYKEEEIGDNTNVSTFSSAVNKSVKEALAYEYPYRGLWKIPSKVSVTELKRLQNPASDNETYELLYSPEIKTPRFIRAEKKMTAAERGTLVHFIMETIDLSLKTENDVRDFAEGLCRQNIITPESAAQVPYEKIAAFLTSPLGERLRKADRVFREEPFTMLTPVPKVMGDTKSSDEKIMVQGIIDCFFFEGDKIILLDFKTDKVRDIQAIKSRYKTQIDLYAEALEKKYFSKVYEKFIYLFDNNGIIRYD
ncbi:MAG: helicase-exonuclease AddAB subunit AddA [Clostridia bacterium]|nr:helicase-exonuclease AddAB subunit AddA [Clostridia bacterium]